mgnify:CR=1 FL=1
MATATVAIFNEVIHVTRIQHIQRMPQCRGLCLQVDAGLLSDHWERSVRQIAYSRLLMRSFDDVDADHQIIHLCLHDSNLRTLMVIGLVVEV